MGGLESHFTLCLFTKGANGPNQLSLPHSPILQALSHVPWTYLQYHCPEHLNGASTMGFDYPENAGSMASPPEMSVVRSTEYARYELNQSFSGMNFNADPPLKFDARFGYSNWIEVRATWGSGANS